MADNLTLNSGSGGGTVRSLEDGSGIHHPVGVTAFATTVGTPDVLSIVTPTAGLPVRLADGSGYLSALPVTDNGGTLSVDDGGGSLTVDGTVGVSGSVAVTGTFWQATQPVSIAATVAVSAASLPLPTGAATSAKQDTEIGHLATLAATRANGTGTVAADAYGFPALGRMPDDTGVVLPLTDTTPGASDAGLIVRTAGTTAVSLASVPSHAVTNAGTFAVQAAQSGTWNVTNVSGTISLPTGAATESTLSTLNGKVTACNTGAVVLSSGTVTTVSTVTSLSQFAGNAINLGNGATGTGTLRVTLANDSTGVLATVSTVTNLAQLGGAAIAMGTGVRSAGTQRVTIATDDVVPASQSGTWNIGTVTTLTTCTTLTGSGVAHDAADSGNPHKIGAKATTALSGLTLVADADRTDLRAGVDGVQITRPHCNLEDIVSGQAAITDGSSTSVIAAQGSGVKTYITTVIVANSSATAVNVDIRDGTGGSVKLTVPVPANNGGCVVNLPVPLPFSANTAVAADPSAAASTVTVTLIGFKSKV